MKRRVFNALAGVSLVVCVVLGGCDDNGAGNKSQDQTVELISSPATMPVGAPYNKITVGMKYREVFSLLGKPMTESGFGTSILTYQISPTEEFILQTTGTGDGSVVLKIVYKRTKK